MPSLLEIDSVLKSFNGQQVLTDIYLKCRTGDIIGMLGRNGSGKSTFLKILFGVLRAEYKFIRIDNKIYEQPFKIKNCICYLPQDSFIPSAFRVEKAVSSYYSKHQSDSFFDDPILDKIRKNRIYHLSGGELRYLEIKLILFLDCKFILLDEPFNGISPLMVESIKELIKAKSENKGIILTDHDYRNILDVANRYCLIYDGGIKEIRDKSELVKWGYLPETKVNN